MNWIIAFTILRFAFGINIMLHGWVRLNAGSENFAKVCQAEFANTGLPEKWVVNFALALPVAEFVIGLMLLTGLLTQVAILSGSLIMLLLILGKSIKADWQTVTFQMIYVLFYAALEMLLPYNNFSIDFLVQTK